MELETHPFVLEVLERGAAVDKLLGNRGRAKVLLDYDREPDEHEYFLISVAIAMDEFLSCCHQLDQIPILLASHRQTTTMEQAGINRHWLIVYHLENYIIRTRGLLDRLTKLVDAVFQMMPSVAWISSSLLRDGRTFIQTKRLLTLLSS